MSKLSSVNISIQRHLFPALEEKIGKLSEKEQKFVRIIELNHFLPGYQWCGIGRKKPVKIVKRTQVIFLPKIIFLSFC